MTNIVFLSDEVRSLVGMPYTASLMARYLTSIGFRVFFVSTYISEEARSVLEGYGITPLSLRKSPLADSYDVSYMLNFIGETLIGYNTRFLNKYYDIISNSIVLNFSNYFIARSHIWYGGGPISHVAEEIIKDKDKVSKLSVPIQTVITLIDRIFLGKVNLNAYIKCFVSNFIRQKYSSFGISSSCVIYPPIDSDIFKPVETPTSDYVVVYFGKETKYKIVKAMLDAGIRIKAFGGKGARYAPRSVLEHKNLEFFGYVSFQVLRELYANAKYTAFPFTAEPFGYVPVESMACGTPVLTYNMQGPAETVENGVSGWLVADDAEFIRMAKKIWERGYDPQMRISSRKRGLLFDYRIISKRWVKLINLVFHDLLINKLT